MFSSHRTKHLTNIHGDYQIAARVLATYLIPGCVGRGVRLGSENSSGGGAGGGAGVWAQVGGPTLGPSGWAHAGPTWVGPSWAQVGPSWAQARYLGPKRIQKIKILKIQFRSAQNVGKVWISRKKILLCPFGPTWAHFLRGPEKSKKCTNFACFPWWANGPYSTKNMNCS